MIMQVISSIMNRECHRNLRRASLLLLEQHRCWRLRTQACSFGGLRGTPAVCNTYEGLYAVKITNVRGLLGRRCSLGGAMVVAASYAAKPR